MNRFQYFLQFFKDPKVAALGPTSTGVVNKVCEELREDEDLQLLELGPGDGVITRELLKRLTPGSRILAIETNERFCEELRALNDPRLVVVQDKAQHFPEHMKANGFEGFHRIISGIPCTILTHDERMELVMKMERELRPGGSSLFYQLSPLMKKYIRSFMELEDTDIKMNGLLPMFVMRGRKRCKKDPVERDQA